MGVNKLRIKTALRAMIFLLMMSAALFAGNVSVYAQSDDTAAEDIIKQCEVVASKRIVSYQNLWDGGNYYVFAVEGNGEQYLSVDLKGNAAQGIYIRWAREPSPWRLEAALADGQTVDSRHGEFGFLQEYAALPQGTVSFRMITDDGKTCPLEMVELEVYSPGTLPDSVHIWQPTPSTAELMVVSTHQDDELLFFGGTIPYYSGEKQLDTLVVYMAFDNNLRLHEALEGIWTCGGRQHPVFLNFPDKGCRSLKTALEYWREHKVNVALVDLMVSYRPQVIVTHDVDGEYGHGQHKLTVYCIKNALKYAEDEGYVSKYLPGKQPWSVNKCYLHLYNRNRVVLPWDQMNLESAGGMNAMDVARKAYQCHVSQHKFAYVVGHDEETFDSRKFGLYRSKVGEDVSKNDFFENITLRYTSAQPTETVPGWLERTGRHGWHYRVTDPRWQGSGYLRWCTVGGVSGWYESDITGSLTEPATRVELIIDDTSLDLSAYSTLTLISESPRVFSYSNGIVVSDLPVRYCAVGDGQPGFYLADRNDGSLLEPEQQVHVAPLSIGELTLPQLSLSSGDSSGTRVNPAIIVLCCLLVVTAFALSIEVIRLISINKRRSARSARRPYPYDRDRRYR